jgi:hypothetical protein
MSVEADIEKAIEALVNAASSGFEYPLNVVASCTESDNPERDVAYPCVVIACSPFVNDTPRSPLGYCALSVVCMTDQNDDKRGVVVDQMCAFTFPVIDKDLIGLTVYSPWLLCGINDTGPSEINVDEDANLNIRGREFQIALADMTSALTTTTTTTGG